MAILDAHLRFSNKQALTGTTPIVSTNTYDVGAGTPTPRIGTGEPLELRVSVDVAAGGGTPTCLVELIQSAAADMTVSPDVIAASGVQPAAALTAGAVITVPIPQGTPTKRYIAVRYTQGGTTPTLTVSAYLQPRSMSSVDPQSYKSGMTGPAS